jgi:hypothetical protein
MSKSRSVGNQCGCVEREEYVKLTLTDSLSDAGLARYPAANFAREEGQVVRNLHFH